LAPLTIDTTEAFCSAVKNEIMLPVEGSDLLQSLIARLSEIQRSLINQEAEFRKQIMAAHPRCQKSARNLIHYLALRRHDIRQLQEQLAELGLSSLGRMESRTLFSIQAVLKVLNHLAQRGWVAMPGHEGQIVDFAEPPITTRCWGRARRTGPFASW
jgi:hypothetical protein